MTSTTKLTELLVNKLGTRTSPILKQIASKCGLNNGGTKPVLIQRIAEGIQTPLLRPLPTNTPHRILSIDMGIRNLALCLVHIPLNRIPKITEWSRVTVSERPEVSETPVPETFEPIDYAGKAYALMKYSLEQYQPHTILIERQRYRSGSSSAIQEWTVRVNMLESMFHAVLHTIAQNQPNVFVVYSVSPKKVTNLWLEDIEEKLNARETKLAKIAVVERILQGEEMEVVLSGQAKEIAEGFNIGQRGGGLKKSDDLADSMLQGLGWWRWHVNRLKLKDEILDWEQPTKAPKAEKTSRKDGIAKPRRQRKTKVVEMPMDGDEKITTLETIVDDRLSEPAASPRKKKPKVADHEREMEPKGRSSTKKGASKSPKSSLRSRPVIKIMS